jgi:hypothetical protein
MPQCKFAIVVKVLDAREGTDEDWNYIAYLLCEIAGKVYLLEKKI